MANTYWNGLGGNNYYDTAGNWLGAVVPAGGNVTLDNSVRAGSYTVLVRAGFTYALSYLTVSGSSSASVVSLTDAGSMSFSSPLTVRNATLTVNASATLTGVGAAAKTEFASNVTFNIFGMVRIGGRFGSTAGASNVINEIGGTFIGNWAYFTNATTWNLSAASTVQFSGLVQGASLSFVFKDATADHLSFGAQGRRVFSSISGFQGRNAIDLTRLGYSSALTVRLSGAGIEIDNGATTVMKFDRFSFGAGSGIGSLVLSSDGGTGTRLTVCFAEGTRILAEFGEVAVEALQAGALIAVQERGELVLRAVTFVGRRRIDLLTHPLPETAAPIRIRAGALADGVPSRDLLVSPDHAMFLRGVLVPARLLLNGRTIVAERGWRSVVYYHVELAAHAILFAEGAAAESYLDSGNRGFFENAPAPLLLRPDLPAVSSRGDSCASLTLAEADIWPIWTELAERAEALRPAPQANSPPQADSAPPIASCGASTTPDAGIRLLSATGALRPIDPQGEVCRFVLPAGTTELRLQSRSSSPAALKPWLDDRRRLGVRVHRIDLRIGAEWLTIPLDHPQLTDGWWPLESGGVAAGRWTDGAARLLVPALPQPAILEVHLTTQAAYAIEPALPLAA